MDITLRDIPHSYQRYETCGDYFEMDGSVNIRVSKMRNERHILLVAVHELVEYILVKHRGINIEVIDDFDKQFEREREAGLHSQEAEPGDALDSPYRKEHFFATNIERQLALELGVDWAEYSAEVESL